MIRKNSRRLSPLLNNEAALGKFSFNDPLNSSLCASSSKSAPVTLTLQSGQTLAPLRSGWFRSVYALAHLVILICGKPSSRSAVQCGRCTSEPARCRAPTGSAGAVQAILKTSSRGRRYCSGLR